MNKDNSIYTTLDRGASVMPQRIWKDAFRDKAVAFSTYSSEEQTTGYRILWYLWSADIWFDRFPLLKFILAVNVVVWILQFVL